MLAVPNISVQAFPGAYGWGATSRGGRGGRTIWVTNLNNAGPGSLREAVQFASEPRIVKFRVGGVIRLERRIAIEYPFITIDAQDAPGMGVAIENDRFSIRTHDVIMRYIRYRGTGESSDDEFLVFRSELGSVSGQRWGCHDIIIDHCSGAWWLDDALSISYQGVPGVDEFIYNITIQNCLFAEPDRGHPTSIHMGTNSKAAYVHHISYHNNLLVTHGRRGPNIVARHAEVVNNVNYNWASRIGQLQNGDDHTDGVEVDLVNNYWKSGPASSTAYYRFDDEGGAPIRDSLDDPPNSIFIAGNISPKGLVGHPHNPNPYLDPAEDNWPMIHAQQYGGVLLNENVHRRLERLEQPEFPIPEVSAIEAYDRVLIEVGVSHRRDQADIKFVNDVINDTGPDDEPIAPGGTYFIPEVGMSVVTTLEVIETELRQQAQILLVQADAILQTIVDLRAADDAIDAAADVIEVD